jgi:hypothetical protein
MMCVNLVYGQRRLFPILLEVSKPRWTFPPPPRRVTTIIKAILRPTQN